MALYPYLSVSKTEIICYLSQPGYGCGWGPRVDGFVVPDAPRLLRENGDYSHVPEMIGVNSEDGFIFQDIGK